MTNGLLLSGAQTFLFLCGAVAEGFATIDGLEPSAARRAVSRRKAEYEELLLAALLHGAPTFVGNSSLFGPILNANALAREGLFLNDDEDYTESERMSLARDYEGAWDILRATDRDEHVGVVVPLEVLREGSGIPHKKRLRLARQEAELEDAIARVEGFVRDIQWSLPAIFGHYYTRQCEAFFQTIVDLNDHVIEGHDDPGAPAETQDILSEMGLRRARPQELEKDENPFGFHPDDLRGLWSRDQQLSSNDFNSYFANAVDLTTAANPLTVLRQHAYWRTTFELLNATRASSLGKGTLFVPSAVHVPTTAEVQGGSNELVRVYRMHLRHRTAVPRLEGIADLLTLREDARLNPLREVLSGWLEASRNGDIPLALTIASDIGKAEAEAKNLQKLQKISDFASYIGLPLGVAEALLGSNVGLALAPIGPAVSLWSRIKSARFSWMQFGTSND